MSDRRKLSRIAAATILAFAVATPTAFAMPFQEAQQKDMHASTVQVPQSQQLDLRGEHSSSVQPQTKAPTQTQGDLRGEHSKTPTDTAPIAGPPVFPRYVGPAPASQPAVADDGNDVEWPVIGIGLAVALLLGGGLGYAAYKTRSPKPAH